MRRKVIAEKKAYDLVKQLIEEDVDQDFFVKSVSNLGHFHVQCRYCITINSRFGTFLNSCMILLKCLTLQYKRIYC